MKKITIIVLALLSSINHITAQNKSFTISSLDISKDSITIHHLESDLELRTPYLETVIDFQIDHDYACILYKSGAQNFAVSAAYQIDGKWYQDFCGCPLGFPSDGFCQYTTVSVELESTTSFILKYFDDCVHKSKEVHTNTFILSKNGLRNVTEGSTFHFRLSAKQNPRTDYLKQ